MIEEASLPDPLRTYRPFSLRVRAALLDNTINLIPLSACLLVLIPMFQSTIAGIALAAWVAIGLQTVLEYPKKASSGLFRMGLQLTHPTKIGFFRILARNIIKYYPLVCIFAFGITFILNAPISPFEMGLFGLSGLIVAYNLASVATGRESLHNQLTGLTIKPVENTKPRFISLYLSTVGLFGVGFLGLLVILPNFIGACDRAPSSSVKANMHTLQTMVETYAVDYGGVYPPSVQVLEKEAKAKGYWKDFTNPTSGYSGYGKSYVNEWDSKAEGIVTYDPVKPDYTKYFIYGHDPKGKRIQNKDRDFFLTNS